MKKKEKTKYYNAKSEVGSGLSNNQVLLRNLELKENIKQPISYPLTSTSRDKWVASVDKGQEDEILLCGYKTIWGYRIDKDYIYYCKTGVLEEW